MDGTRTRTRRRRRRARLVWARRTAARARFYLVTFLTIVVVAYVVVPFASSVLSSIGDYQPQYYDPKDVTRLDYRAESDRGVRATPRVVESVLSADGALGIGLVVLVAIMWLAVVPAPSRRDDVDD